MAMRTLTKISLSECGLLFVALPVVLSVRFALWLLPSPTIVRALRRYESAHGSEAALRRVSLERIIWAVEAAAKRIPRATCLTQAIAASMLLRRFGYHAQLCLGVAHGEDGSLRAHAWLEREGRAVLGGAGARRLTRLPLFSGKAEIPVLTSLTR